MSTGTDQIVDSTIARAKILPVLAFASCLVFPATAYAHSPGPVIVLALVVFVSAGVFAGFVKWLMQKFSIIVDATVPGNAILKVQSAEILLMVVSSLTALWAIENAIPLQLIGYFSLKGAKWYFSYTTAHLFVSQEILLWTLIQAFLAPLPNLVLLRGQGAGLSRSVAIVKKSMSALALGWIALVIVWGLIAVTAYPRLEYDYERFVSKKESDKAQLQAELMKIASSKGFLRLVQRLEQDGFDVNADTDLNGMTPLMWASINGHIDLVRFLLGRGADINQQARLTGATALMCAASRGHAKVVKELLQKGAKADVADRKGWMALEFAERSGHAETATMLKQWASGK